jgi:hypothetical protein
MTHRRWKVKAAFAGAGANRRLHDDQSVFNKNGCRSLGLKRRTISRPCHLASGRHDGLRSLDLRHPLPAPTDIFFVEQLGVGQIRRTTLCASAGRIADRPSSCSPCRRGRLQIPCLRGPTRTSALTFRVRGGRMYLPLPLFGSPAFSSRIFCDRLDVIGHCRPIFLLQGHRAGKRLFGRIDPDQGF